MISQELLESVKLHEGYRDKAYYDTEGVLTIGYGRNLENLVIDRETGEKWLREDLEVAHADAERFPEWEYLDTRTRRDVFVEMVYNLGATRLAGFKNTLAAIRARDWDEVAEEMMDSRWARQVGRRALRLATRMREG